MGAAINRLETEEVRNILDSIAVKVTELEGIVGAMNTLVTSNMYEAWDSISANTFKENWSHDASAWQTKVEEFETAVARIKNLTTDMDVREGNICNIANYHKG